MTDVLPASPDGAVTYPGLVFAKAWHASLQTTGSAQGALAISSFARCLPLYRAGPLLLNCVSCIVRKSQSRGFLCQNPQVFTLKKGAGFAANGCDSSQQ